MYMPFINQRQCVRLERVLIMLLLPLILILLLFGPPTLQPRTANDVFRWYYNWRLIAKIPADEAAYGLVVDCIQPDGTYHPPGKWSNEAALALLLYNCVFQAASCVRSVGTNLMWLLYHLTLLHMQERMRSSRLRSTRSLSKSSTGTALADSLNSSLGGSSGSADNSDSTPVFISKVTIAQLVMSLDMELDSMLHLVYDRTILNKVRW